MERIGLILNTKIGFQNKIMNKTLLRIVTGQYEYVELTAEKILTPEEVKEYTRQYRMIGDEGVREQVNKEAKEIPKVRDYKDKKAKAMDSFIDDLGDETELAEQTL